MPRTRMHAPSHPGKILREAYMTPPGIDSYTLAADLRISPAVLDAVLAERQAVSFELAYRIVERFGGDVASWLTLQEMYDVKTARRLRRPAPKREAEILRGIEQDQDLPEQTPEQMKQMTRRSFVGPPRPRKAPGPKTAGE